MEDFFGYTREIKANGQIVSSEFAVLAISGASEVSLVQNVQATYQQKAEPRFEAGSANLYWLAGQPMGEIQVERLVGSGGLEAVKSMKGGGGSLKSLNISFNGKGGLAGASTAPDKLKFEGAVPLSVGINFRAGNMEVGENIAIRAASMVIE